MQATIDSHEEDREECAICLDPVSPDLRAQVQACSHAFCEPCLRNWISRCVKDSKTPQCPLCKGDASSFKYDIKGDEDFQVYNAPQVPAPERPRPRFEAYLLHQIYGSMRELRPLGSGPEGVALMAALSAMQDERALRPVTPRATVPQHSVFYSARGRFNLDAGAALPPRHPAAAALGRSRAVPDAHRVRAAELRADALLGHLDDVLGPVARPRRRSGLAAGAIDPEAARADDRPLRPRTLGRRASTLGVLAPDEESDFDLLLRDSSPSPPLERDTDDSDPLDALAPHTLRPLRWRTRPPPMVGDTSSLTARRPDEVLRGMPRARRASPVRQPRVFGRDRSHDGRVEGSTDGQVVGRSGAAGGHDSAAQARPARWRLRSQDAAGAELGGEHAPVAGPGRLLSALPSRLCSPASVHAWNEPVRASSPLPTIPDISPYVPTLPSSPPSVTAPANASAPPQPYANASSAAEPAISDEDDQTRSLMRAIRRCLIEMQRAEAPSAAADDDHAALGPHAHRRRLAMVRAARMRMDSASRAPIDHEARAALRAEIDDSFQERRALQEGAGSVRAMARDFLHTRASTTPRVRVASRGGGGVPPPARAAGAAAAQAQPERAPAVWGPSGSRGIRKRRRVEADADVCVVPARERGEVIDLVSSSDDEA